MQLVAFGRGWYRPAAQALHFVAPAVSSYLPGKQLRHSVSPAAEAYLPGKQAMHEAAAIVLEAYVPAAQELQFVAPIASAYLPGRQLRHAVRPVVEAYLKNSSPKMPVVIWAVPSPTMVLRKCHLYPHSRTACFFSFLVLPSVSM